MPLQISVTLKKQFGEALLNNRITLHQLKQLPGLFNKKGNRAQHPFNQDNYSKQEAMRDFVALIGPELSDLQLHKLNMLLINVEGKTVRTAPTLLQSFFIYEAERTGMLRTIDTKKLLALFFPDKETFYKADNAQKFTYINSARTKLATSYPQEEQAKFFNNLFLSDEIKELYKKHYLPLIRAENKDNQSLDNLVGVHFYFNFLMPMIVTKVKEDDKQLIDAILGLLNTANNTSILGRQIIAYDETKTLALDNNPNNEIIKRYHAALSNFLTEIRDDLLNLPPTTKSSRLFHQDTLICNLLHFLDRVELRCNNTQPKSVSVIMDEIKDLTKIFSEIRPLAIPNHAIQTLLDTTGNNLMSLAEQTMNVTSNLTHTKK